MQKISHIRSALTSLALAAVAFASSSCVDSTAPSGSFSNVTRNGASGDLISGLGVGQIRVVDTTVAVLQRLLPLGGDITRSAVIGSAGGSIAIPEAGFQLDIPKNALAVPTTITVTAVQGSAAAYEFEPHGIVFNKRLFVTQDLSVTAAIANLLGASFSGGYFQSRDEISPSGSATVHELEPANVDLFSTTVRFPINHFSGYLVAVD